jgi:hypothetical protein
MKKLKLISVLIGSVVSCNSFAYLSCNDQGYNDYSTNVNATSNWVSVIATETVGTYTDGTLSGVDAVAYEFGLKDWNQAYKSQWCSNYEASITSTIPPYGVPHPVIGTFSCSWNNEPTSSSDVTTVIHVTYCKTKGIRFDM